MRRLLASLLVVVLAPVLALASGATPAAIPPECNSTQQGEHRVQPELVEGLPTSPEARCDDANEANEAANEAGEADDEEALSGSDDEDDEVVGAAPSEKVTSDGLTFTADLDDQELERRFLHELPSLGTISVGLPEAGRVINAVRMKEGAAWTLVTPTHAWGTQETIEALERVAETVRRDLPQVAPLRVNHIGAPQGGYLRPHHSHQSGRDADLGFYYQEGVDPRRLSRAREKSIDLQANWALLRALASETDVEVVLLDRRIQRILYDYALSVGENRAWLDSLFRSGAASMIRHARRHRDHFHVRFYAPRSQELGRRVQPLLARRADQNLALHRVRRGDTLGRLAVHYGSTVRLIQHANALPSTFLRQGRTLKIPLRGPCTRCPLPPPIVIPPRRAPPLTPEA